MPPVSLLQRLDKNPIPDGGMECRVTMIMRNEGLRLPFLLHYYRELGVARFFIVDNGSDDGGREYLLTQQDCHVFLTHQPFAEARCGVAWHQEILQAYGESHWWVTVDADELLVYPDCENVKLPAFCRSLEAEGAEGMYALMLDMYGKGPIASAECVSGKSFIETCPYFDADYAFKPRLSAPWQAKPFPPLEPIGGPRLRVFYPEFKTGGMLALVATKISRKLRAALKRFGIHLNLPHAVPPMLFKIPLFKWKSGLVLVSSHIAAPLKLSEQTGALLHFKFFADFHQKALTEVTRGQHFDGASEYTRYLVVLKSNPGLSFYHDKSVAYAGSKQLISLGLMKEKTPKQT